MTDRKLNVYSYMLIDPRLFAVSEHHKQASVYVACDSQKRASELIDTTIREMQQHGGVIGNKRIVQMCRAEPEVIFVEVSHARFIRMDDLVAGQPLDEAKVVTLDMHDDELHGRYTESAAFGMIHVSRVSGGKQLFQVDYPQDHYIDIVINRARLNRNLSTDRVFADDELIRVSMSEVQWARMIASPNTMGVPCTLARYIDNETKEFMTPVLPERHVADASTFKGEVKDKTDQAVASIREAEARLAEIMKGPLRKSDLQEVQELLRAAAGGMGNSVMFVLDRAEETIDEAVESAKAEVDAHIDYSLQRLGERALGARLQEALDSGVNVREIGRTISIALDDKIEKPD